MEESQGNLSCSVSFSLAVSAFSNISCLVKPVEVWLAEHISSTHSLREKQDGQRETDKQTLTLEHACVIYSPQAVPVFFFFWKHNLHYQKQPHGWEWPYKTVWDFTKINTTGFDGITHREIQEIIVYFTHKD